MCARVTGATGTAEEILAESRDACLAQSPRCTALNLAARLATDWTRSARPTPLCHVDANVLWSRCLCCHLGAGLRPGHFQDKVLLSLLAGALAGWSLLLTRQTQHNACWPYRKEAGSRRPPPAGCSFGPRWNAQPIPQQSVMHSRSALHGRVLVCLASRVRSRLRCIGHEATGRSRRAQATNLQVGTRNWEVTCRFSAEVLAQIVCIWYNTKYSKKALCHLDDGRSRN